MAFDKIVVEEGHSNYVVQINGLSSDAANSILITASTLSPPCQGLRLMKISYDCGAGESVKLKHGGATNPFLTITEGNGQTICYFKQGGIPDLSGGNGNILIESVTGVYSLRLHFKKQKPVIPL